MRVNFIGYFYREEKVKIKNAIEIFDTFFNISNNFSFNLNSVSKDEISSLNFEYFNNKGPTDVLSFPLFSGIEEIQQLNKKNEDTLGDMFFCRPILKKNAAVYHKSLTEELQLVLVHGLLHLVGYSHVEEIELQKIENTILDKVWSGSKKS
ncbi:rRNA maturation RNase YbeY [Candidatus Actinomarina]|nr:rRNA maturation RNase YbeY [Candidatus Actinomarina sp.]